MYVDGLKFIILHTIYLIHLSNTIHWEPIHTRGMIPSQCGLVRGTCPGNFRPGRNESLMQSQRVNSFPNHQEVVGNTLSNEHDQATLSACEFCRYPCQAPKEFGEKCKISSYLEQWHEDIEGKPHEFDRTYYCEHHGGFEIAAVSLGGRQRHFWKEENQDEFFVLPIHAGDEGAPYVAIGMFDGHGENGGIAAKIAKNAFASKLESFINLEEGDLFSDRSINESLLEVLFAHTAHAVDSYPCNFDKSGTTAVVCIASPESVTSGWIGDSRAIVGLTQKKSRDGSVAQLMIPLTKDHKPDPLRCPEEAIRVTKEGGRIDRLTIDNQGRPTGPYRVFLKDRWIPGLAVSRAFGDHMAKKAGVISSPDIASLNLKSIFTGNPEGSRQIMIVGTDGLWEWIDNQDAIDLALSMHSAEDAAHALAEAAQKNWALYCQGQACDDITVAVVYFP